MNKGSSLNYDTLKMYKTSINDTKQHEVRSNDKCNNISRRPASLSESFISEIENYRKDIKKK